MKAALRRFVSDRNGRVVIAQPPNLPLLAWAIFGVAAWATSGRWSTLLDFLSGAALVTWAYLEIRYGDSPFRRLLGVAVLIALVATRALRG